LDSHDTRTTIRGSRQSYAYALVQDGLADIPKEATQELHDLTCERLDIYIAQAHAGAVMRVPLRDKHGHAVLDDNGNVIMVPPDPKMHLAYLIAAERFTLDRAKFAGLTAPEKGEIAHSGEITMIGGDYMFPMKDDEDFARQVAATSQRRS
jgi:hypothetical protein